MAYEVLARKWRPQQFDDVVGQEHVTRTLKNALSSGRVAHAYLFVGPRGIGKTSLSRILAKALNCEKGPTVTPCGVCDACREIASGICLDVIEFDAASNTQVDKVREIIIDNVRYAPARCRTKVYIVDEVHMLSPGSFNALLKTLEEPPAHVKFIFATTEAHKVPATIVSRCQRFDLRRISIRDIVAHLALIAKAEGIKISQDALLAIARGAEGGMRDAESALDQLIAFRGASISEEDVLSVFGLVSRQALEDLTGAILAGNLSALILQIDAMDRAGKDMLRVVVELLETFRNLMVMTCAPEAATALDILDAQTDTLKAMAGKTSTDNLLRMADLLVQAESRIRYALSRKTLLETTLIRCARTASMVSIDDLLAKIHALKDMLAAGEAGASAAGADSLRETAPRFVVRDPVAAPEGTGDLNLLQRRWATVLEEAGKRVAAVKAVLLHGRPVDAVNGVVTVAFEPAFAGQVKKLTDTPRYVSALQAGMQEVVRHPIRVDFRILGEKDSSAAIPEDKPVQPLVNRAPSPAAPRVEEAPGGEGVEAEASTSRISRRDLVEHPIVQTAVRIFKGQITDIQQGRTDTGP
jgi:DNA polymerase III subunit gamma/tau